MNDRALLRMPIAAESKARKLTEPGQRGSILPWNRLEMDYPGEKCVQELFEEQVARTPEALAVVDGERRLSYGELNEKAERLARYLVEGGAGLETRIGIYLRRSLEMMVGILGVLKAGGTYVPLEPGLPNERVRYMAEDAGIEWLLVDSKWMETLPGVRVVLMDGAGTKNGWLEEAGGSGLDEEVEGVQKMQGVEGARRKVSGENLAYILYTSGSTGKPKGVMVPHRGLSNYLAHALAMYLGEEIKGSVVSSPLSFDATLTTLLPPLLVGKWVDLLPDDETTLSRLAERLFVGGRAIGSAAAAEVEGEAAAKRDFCERVRTDGSGGGMQCVDPIGWKGIGGVGGIGGGAYRARDREHAVVCVGGGAAVATGEQCGGIVHRRRGIGAGLCEPTGDDGGEVCAQPVQQCGRRAALPDRGQGEVV